MMKPTGPIRIGQYPCVTCHKIRRTALGAWACWRLHLIQRQEAAKQTHAYILGTGRLQ